MVTSGSSEPTTDNFEYARRQLIAEIAQEARLAASFTGRPQLAPKVLEAVARVPRPEFVHDRDRAFAYLNEPLPIGHGQTISQPYIVALMTDLLAPTPEHVVLDVGTGSGYQAAVLSRLVRQVYSVEVVPELAAHAAERLSRLGYDNVEVRYGDGARGWPAHAPFDGILVAAAAEDVPAALIDQLKAGGRLIIPIGTEFGQSLQLIEKDAGGTVRQRLVLPVAFVPLVRPYRLGDENSNAGR